MFFRAPRELLEEIILVDDASERGECVWLRHLGDGVKGVIIGGKITAVIRTTGMWSRSKASVHLFDDNYFNLLTP